MKVNVVSYDNVWALPAWLYANGIYPRDVQPDSITIEGDNIAWSETGGIDMRASSPLTGHYKVLSRDLNSGQPVRNPVNGQAMQHSCTFQLQNPPHLFIGLSTQPVTGEAPVTPVEHTEALPQPEDEGSATAAHQVTELRNRNRQK